VPWLTKIQRKIGRFLLPFWLAIWGLARGFLAAGDFWRLGIFGSLGDFWQLGVFVIVQRIFPTSGNFGWHGRK
jgi:hypothetical protein